MKYLALVLFVLAGCMMPHGPTAYVAYEPTSDDVSLEVTVKDSHLQYVPVVIRVTGDLVLDRVLVDGESIDLGGDQAAENWLGDEGSTIVHLPVGQHEVLAFACNDNGLKWECGCQDKDDCGYWMKKPFYVNALSR